MVAVPGMAADTYYYIVSTYLLFIIRFVLRAWLGGNKLLLVPSPRASPLGSFSFLLELINKVTKRTAGAVNPLRIDRTHFPTGNLTGTYRWSPLLS